MLKKLFFLSLVSLLVAGCIGGFGGDTGDEVGELSIYLTDAPTNDMDEVWLPINEVQVRRDETWEVLNEFPDGEEIELLSLRFDEALLGEELLPAGDYSQIRLIVEDGQIVFKDDGGTAPLKIPSGAQTGLKIHHDFNVSPNYPTSLIMDVNVVDFIKPAGEAGFHIMNPTAIRVVDRIDSGWIEGWVGEQAQDSEPVAITGQDVFLELWQGEDLIAETIALREEQDERQAGEYRFNGILAGEYELVAYTLKQEEEEAVIDRAAIIEEVVVVAGELTPVEALILEDIDTDGDN